MWIDDNMDRWILRSKGSLADCVGDSVSPTGSYVSLLDTPSVN